jgi:hypothetical protein
MYIHICIYIHIISQRKGADNLSIKEIINADSLSESKERLEMLSNTRRMIRMICKDSATLLGILSYLC